MGRSRPSRCRGTAAAPAGRHRAAVWWARILFGGAVVVGLAAPLLVAADLVQPIALFDDPGLVVAGAGVALLGAALLLAAQQQKAALRARGADPVQATHGLYARVRNPGLAANVVITAGLLLMVPTLLGVLAAVLLVVAVQVQVRAVREPHLQERHGPEFAGYAERAGRFLPRRRGDGDTDGTSAARPVPDEPTRGAAG